LEYARTEQSRLLLLPGQLRYSTERTDAVNILPTMKGHPNFAELPKRNIPVNAPRHTNSVNDLTDESDMLTHSPAYSSMPSCKSKIVIHPYPL
jgi:hypothetical protein